MRRWAIAALLLAPWPLIAAACGADPAPAPVIVLDVPKTEPTATVTSEEPPPQRSEQEAPAEPSEPASDGGVYGFSFSASIATGDGGLDISFRSSDDGGMSFSFGSDGGVLTFGSPTLDGGAPAPSATPRGGRDAGTRTR